MKRQVMVHPIIAGKAPSKVLGFTYLLVLGFILIVLLSLGAASEHVLLTQQREREAELIFIGKQYQNAITRYYHQSPNGIKQFPMTLESLVNDKRFVTTQHHLRKLYQDPMTQAVEWGVIKNEFGQITGVYSLSNQVPIKKNIDFLKQSGNQIISYSDWKFEYVAESNATLGLGGPVKTDEPFSTGLTLKPLE